MRWVSKLVLSLLLTLSVSVYSASRGIPEVLATNVTTYYYRNETTDEDSANLATLVNAGESMRATQNSANAIKSFAGADLYWYSRVLPTGSLDATIPGDGGGVYTLNLYAQSVPTGTKTHTWDAQIGYCYGGSGDPCGTGATYTALDSALEEGNQTYTSGTATGLHVYTWAGVNNATTCTSASPCRLYIMMDYISRGQGGAWDIGYNNTSGNYQTNVVAPSAITVPENIVFLALAAPLMVMIVLWLKKRKALLMNYET